MAIKMNWATRTTTTIRKRYEKLGTKAARTWNIAKWIATDRIFYFLLFWMCSFLWHALDRLVMLFCGSSWISGPRIDRLRSLTCYEKSAQEVEVCMRDGTLAITDSVFPCHFLYRHIRYCHPKAILQDPTATLLGVGKEYAMFSVTPSTDVFDVKMHPFLFIAQKKHAAHLYIIPTWSFIKLANTIPSPTSKILIFNMTARCGSTLIAQGDEMMLHRMGKVRAFTEPWCFNDLHFLYRNGEVHMDEYKRLLKACYKVLFRDDSRYTHIVAKLSPFASAQCPLMADMFPETKFFYLTRGVEDTVKSFIKIFPTVMPLSSLIWRGVRFWATQVAFPYDDDSLWDLSHRVISKELEISTDEIHGLNLALMYYNYVQNRARYDGLLMYEELLEEPQAILSKICAAIDLPENNSQLALEAMHSDSQNGLFGHRGVTKVDLSEAQMSEISKGFRTAGCSVKAETTAVQLKDLLLNTNLRLSN